MISIKDWAHIEERKFPSLDKEGWTRHQAKCREASFDGADGVVCSTSDYRWLEPTTPSARSKDASRYFLDRAATPPCPRRGIVAALILFAIFAFAPTLVIAQQDQKQPEAAQTKTEEPKAEEPKAEETQPQTDKDGKLISVPGGKALGMSILGNQEAPKALVIVPWKRSELGNVLGISTLLDDSRLPVDKEVFMRMLSYYEIRSETAPGGGLTKNNAAQPATATQGRK